MVLRVFVTLVAMMGIATPAALAQDLPVYKVAGGGREFDARDGMRATGVYLTPGPATVRADGSFLVSGFSSGVVWRVDNQGRLRRVIGVRRPVPGAQREHLGRVEPRDAAGRWHADRRGERVRRAAHRA
jgi:hypothetical protein